MPVVPERLLKEPKLTWPFGGARQHILPVIIKQRGVISPRFWMIAKQPFLAISG
jgi:hypothetical protein